MHSIDSIFLNFSSSSATAHYRCEMLWKALWNLLQRLFVGESESHSAMSDSAITWTIQSMEFSRPEYWSG